jgi:enoyl-CoA hydratase/carnithine racemase
VPAVHTPLRSERCGGTLTLTLDTPNAEINVFTREAAEALCRILAGVDPSETSAVLLRTAKPHSFVNGVGLLLAGTMKRTEDGANVTRPVREAYRALKTCVVPTIAVIEGNCYGCGVELAVQCTHRIAVDTFDTHFRMTELADYLFLPMFGGTQDLPRVLGLPRAIDFVLWGERWSARQAAELGLVDRCVASGSLESAVQAFAEEVAKDQVRRAPGLVVTPSDALEARSAAEQRIATLPAAYRETYAAGLALLERAAKASALGPEDYENEVSESAKSLMSPSCRAAWPFFFIRQSARALARIDGVRTSARGVAFEAESPDLVDLAASLSTRCSSPRPSESPPSATAVAERGPESAPIDVRIWSEEDAQGHDDGLAARLRIAPWPHDARRHILYAPFLSAGIEVIELASPAHAVSRTERVVSAALARTFTVVRSKPGEAFALDQLVSAWLVPQIAYLTRGGAAADLAETLRAFGFTRLAGDLVDALDSDALFRSLARRSPVLVRDPSAVRDLPRIATATGGLERPVVADALVASLAGTAARILREKCLSHPCAVDVLARDVLDFPLQHTSLCRYLTLSRARRLLDEEDSYGHLVDPGDMVSLKEFVEHGREYYIGHV